MKLFLVIICMVSNNCFSQSLKDLFKIDDDAQHCADTTLDVIACENLHYYQMDNMLNLTFKKLKTLSKSEDFRIIKAEQIKWLDTRNKQFKKIESEGDCGVSPDICQALLISKKTSIVRKRVEILIKRYPLPAKE